MFNEQLPHKTGITWSTLKLPNDYTITRYYVPVFSVDSYVNGKWMRRTDIVFMNGKAYRIVVIRTLSMMGIVKRKIDYEGIDRMLGKYGPCPRPIP